MNGVEMRGSDARQLRDQAAAGLPARPPAGAASPGFGEWLAGTYPEGMGDGFGGTYSQDDMEAAWNAGQAAGKVTEVARLYRGVYRGAPDGYPDAAVTEQECPLCGAPAGYLCFGQHGVICHTARAKAWENARDRLGMRREHP